MRGLHTGRWGPRETGKSHILGESNDEEKGERISEGQERDRKVEEERCFWMKARGKIPLR